MLIWTASSRELEGKSLDSYGHLFVFETAQRSSDKDNGTTLRVVDTGPEEQEGPRGAGAFLLLAVPIRREENRL